MASLPSPSATGQYKVGTSTFSLTDESRFELLGDNPGSTKRRVFARLYYPVLPEDAKAAPRAVIMSATKLKALAKMYHFPAGKAEPSESDRYIDAKPADGKFPLVIFSHGSGSYAESNDLMCADLASHGYNILTVGHAYESVANEYDDGTVEFAEKGLATKVYKPYVSACFALIGIMRDKKSNDRELYEKFKAFRDKYCSFLLVRLEERAKDIKLVTEEAITRFGDRIDTSSGIGIMGHSLGGATAYYMCQTDDRFTAGINIDGMLFGDYEGLTMHKPFYQISCEDAVNTETKVALDTDAPVYWTVFNGMKHQGFSDLKFFAPVKMLTGKMPADYMHDNLCKIQNTFFDKYLKGSDTDVWYPDTEDIVRRI